MTIYIIGLLITFLAYAYLVARFDHYLLEEAFLFHFFGILAAIFWPFSWATFVLFCLAKAIAPIAVNLGSKHRRSDILK